MQDKHGATKQRNDGEPHKNKRRKTTNCLGWTFQRWTFRQANSS